MSGPKNGYSQLFYFSKQKIREIFDYEEPANQTESFMHDLEEIVAKFESLQAHSLPADSQQDEQDQPSQQSFEYTKVS